MDNHQIHNAMLHLDPVLIQEAAEPVIHKKRMLRPLALAACLLLLIAVPVMAVTGSLLVEHYFGETIPRNLADQELDSFFRANTGEKVPVTAVSPQLQEGEPGVSHYSFDTLDEAEDFLGLEIVELNLDHRGHSVTTTYADGTVMSDSPCSLTLIHSSEGQLYGLSLQYFFRTQGNDLLTLNANAVTDLNPNDNNSSIGVSNESADVVQQTSEEYLTEAGYQTTIISTEYSDGHGWDIAGWTQKNGFVIRFSLSTPDQESGIWAIRDLLDSIQ